jgi:hypothetical protein
MLKDIFRGFADSVQAFVDAKREEDDDKDSESTVYAGSHLVMLLKSMVHTNGVPAEVTDKVIEVIEEWEKTSATRP